MTYNPIMLFPLVFAAIQLGPIRITVPDPGAMEPQVAIENDGHIYVAYGVANTLYVSISANGGKSFGAPVKVGDAGKKLMLGMRRGPRIAVGNGGIQVLPIKN